MCEISETKCKSYAAAFKFQVAELAEMLENRRAERPYGLSEKLAGDWR